MPDAQKKLTKAFQPDRKPEPPVAFTGPEPQLPNQPPAIAPDVEAYMRYLRHRNRYCNL